MLIYIRYNNDVLYINIEIFKNSIKQSSNKQLYDEQMYSQGFIKVGKMDNDTYTSSVRLLLLYAIG